ncbi:hypothetical protein ACIQGZ_00195 [Streptomyces sp. NPDC092296]|uniref:hypothetical protein n=1 Tax=Streptomyces sp. NPDC092296 TaxID=3366012 RepID=UPI0037FED1EF
MATDRLIPGSRRTLLRVYADASCADGRPHLADLRVLLVCDVLLRTAALGGRQSVVGLGLPELAPDQVKALVRDAELLGIHPPTVQAGFRDVPAALGGPADVRVVGHGVAVGGGPDGSRIGGSRVDSSRIDVGAAPFSAEADADAETLFPGLLATDPQTLRLALLRYAPGAPAGLTPAALADAGTTLARWRGLVAQWAREPSRPVHAETVRAARELLAERLDTAAVLELLRGLAEVGEVPAGTRFETFVYLDRVLALELSREIGY